LSQTFIFVLLQNPALGRPGAGRNPRDYRAKQKIELEIGKQNRFHSNILFEEFAASRYRAREAHRMPIIERAKF